MPVIRVNADGEKPTLHCGTNRIVTELDRKDRGTGPVIILIHGYKFQPHHPIHCPHRHIMAQHPRERAFRPPSWPRNLGFGTGHPDEGLAIAFGWNARGWLWDAQRSATQAGRALAEVIAMVHARAPNRPIHVAAHSLGIELVQEALFHLPAGSVDRIIAMIGASFHSRTQEALSTPAGLTAEFINVTSRENDAFDFMFERLIAPPILGDRAIGHGLVAPNAVTLQLDCPGTLSHLTRIGTPVAAPDRRICHWSSYTRHGILRFYHDLLRRRDALPLALLQSGLPQAPAPRWSRLVALPITDRFLPFYQKAS